MAKYNPLKEIKKSYKNNTKQIKIEALEIGRGLAKRFF